MNNGLFLQKLKILTYPMTSYYFYKNAETFGHLNLSVFDENSDENGINEISHEVFDDIREGFYSTKLDSVKLLIKQYWKNDSDEERSTEDLIYIIYNQIGRKYLRIKDGSIQIDSEQRGSNFEYGYKASNDFMEKSFGENHHQLFEWYILKTHINVDTMIAIYLEESRLNKLDYMKLWKSVMMSSNSILNKILEKGMSEQHMHIGATKSFDEMWAWIVSKSGKSDERKKLLQSMKIKTMDGYISLANYIKVSKVIRLVMIYYLHGLELKGCMFSEGYPNAKRYSEECSVADKYEDGCPESKEYSKGLCKFIKKLDESLNSHVLGKYHFEELLKKFSSGYRFTDDEYQDYGYEDLRSILSNMDNIPAMSSGGNDYINKVVKNDFAINFFKDFYYYDRSEEQFKSKFCYSLPIEKLFVSKAIKYIKASGDKEFSKLYFQYDRIKNMVHKYIIQDYTSGKGLDVFSKGYGAQKGITTHDFWEEAFKSQLKGQKIKKLEFRTAPKEDMHKMKEGLMNFFKAYKNILQSPEYSEESYPLIGVVYHFIKRKDGNDNFKCIYDYDLTHDEKYSEKGRNRSKYNEAARNIFKLRGKVKNLDKYVVGIDAASKENDAEPHVFKKAYSYFREHGKCRIEGYDPFVKDIGFTYHVGEEFRDIISGIRHVDEVIEVLGFKAGDRIGHGIVLGIDVEKWAEINSVIYIPANEYLDNLLWEWGLYIHNEEFKNVENIRFLENRIYETVKYIYGFNDGVRVEELYENYVKKQNGETLCSRIRGNYEECPIKNHTKKKYMIQRNGHYDDYPERIRWDKDFIYAALGCKYFACHCEKTIAVNMNANMIKKYKTLQDYMKSKISKRGIIVETNPTSNLYIGEFKTFEDYHITNLSSPDSEDVIVTINTDDPCVFNTRLSNEYSLIYDILMKKGKYSSKEIIEWLNRIRKNGTEYSFIEDRGMSKSQTIDEIQSIIETIEKM